MGAVVGDGPDLDHVSDGEDAGGDLPSAAQRAKVDNLAGAVRLREELHVVEVGWDAALELAAPSGARDLQ